MEDDRAGTWGAGYGGVALPRLAAGRMARGHGPCCVPPPSWGAFPSSRHATVGRGPQELLPTHGAGPSGEVFALLEQHLPGVPIAVHHHHVVGAHPEGIEAAVVSLQAPQPQVELRVPGQLQQAPHQRQGRQAPWAPQPRGRGHRQGVPPSRQPPGAEQGQGQQQGAQQRHGGAGCGAAARGGPL